VQAPSEKQAKALVQQDESTQDWQALSPAGGALSQTLGAAEVIADGSSSGSAVVA
jgi:hypothetical protein